MAYDSLVLSAIINELNSSIIGARIEKIHQPSKTDIVMVFHSPTGKQKLLLSAEARIPRLHLTSGNRENPLTPPLFCMVLRKHLEGGKVTRIVQPDFERIVHFYIESMDELGRLTEKVLICEIMGKHSNVILINKDKEILDGIIRFSHAINRHREVLPGRPYVNPPQQGKSNPLLAAEETFKSLLWEAAASGENLRLDKWLLNTFTGLSPQTCREIVYRSGLTSDYRFETLGDYELQRLWDAFKQVQNIVSKKAYEPTLVLDAQGEVTAFSSIDLLQFGPAAKVHGTMNELTDRFYQSRFDQFAFSQVKDHLNKVVTDELARNHKKMAHQEEAIAAAEAAEELRVTGELITANLHAIKPFEKAVRLVNYYDANQKELLVELDPALSPSQNAQAYFKRYNKAKAGKRNALELMQGIRSEITYLESVAANIEQATALTDLLDIKAEMVEEGYLKEKHNARKKRTKEPESTPMEFISSEGWTIWVGKNNRQNDRLTLKKAKTNDLWLHVKDIPGSHVVIQSGEAEVPEQTLLEAAMLAAYFSKARESSNVPVDYTRKKHVHKPNGAKPGMVIYENQRTVFVTPPKNLEGFGVQ